MSPKARLLTEQRRRNLLDLVDQQGQVTVADMVKRFAISAVTVRSDLDALASLGAVVRSHGGAVRRLEATQDYPLGTKETLHREEKIRIGKAAAELVQPGETIILDSGTTTAEVARHLKRMKTQPLTVITNALNIAMELADLPGVSLIMIGGLLRPVSYPFCARSKCDYGLQQIGPPQRFENRTFRSNPAFIYGQPSSSGIHGGAS